MTPIQQAIAILEEDALTNRIERALEVLRGVPQSPRDDIAKAILVGLGIFSNAEQWWDEGGPWAEAARGAADAVLALSRPDRNTGD